MPKRTKSGSGKASEPAEPMVDFHFKLPPALRRRLTAGAAKKSLDDSSYARMVLKERLDADGIPD